MAFSSGTFSLYTPGNPVVTGTTIQSTWANSTLSDIATGLSTCLLKDGTQVVTANIPFAGFRLTGIGAATAVADAARTDQVQNRSYTALTAVSGTNIVIGTATPIPSAYAIGQVFEWIQATTNTAAATLNVSSLGAKNLYKNSPAGIIACIANDLIAGNTYYARYDTAGSTQFIVLNPSTPNRVNVATALTATGTIQADALEVTLNVNKFGTVASGTGAKLFSGSSTGDFQVIYNGGANQLKVYPQSGGSINSLAANAGHILPINTTAQYWATSATTWVALLSA